MTKKLITLEPGPWGDKTYNVIQVTNSLDPVPGTVIKHVDAQGYMSRGFELVIKSPKKKG